MDLLCKVKILPLKDDYVYQYNEHGCPFVRICPGTLVVTKDEKNKPLITCKCPINTYLDRNKNDCITKCEIIQQYFEKINAENSDRKAEPSGK